MTLRELINSVDSEQYSDSALYQKLRETKPEYGANRRIEVKLVNGEIAITNAHVGSLGDLSYNERRMAIELELTVALDDDAISDLCCQFPIIADYDGVGAKGYTQSKPVQTIPIHSK